MRNVGIRILLCLMFVVQTATLAQAPANLFGFTEHEYDPETGLYYMKGRYYDPETGSFLSVDPAAGNLKIPMTLHPYIYAMVNPTVYIDPDGREVRVLDSGSLELIRRTLPEELQESVQVDEDGLLQRGPLNAVETNDPNFLALRALVNRSEVTAVQSGNEVEFINKDGARVKEPFSFQTREQVIEELVEMGVSREELERDIPPDQNFLFLGMLATPRGNSNSFDNKSTVSLTEEATVTLPGEGVNAPAVEKSKTAAHELFGHALLFQQGEAFQHGEIPERVFDEIEERTEDTYFNDMTGTVRENPDELGVVKESGENEKNR